MSEKRKNRGEEYREAYEALKQQWERRTGKTYETPQERGALQKDWWGGRRDEVVAEQENQKEAAVRRQAASYALSRFYEDSRAIAKQRALAMPGGDFSPIPIKPVAGLSFKDHVRAAGEARQREDKDWAAGLSDEELDKEIRKENPGYEIVSIPDLLTGNKTYFKDGKIERTNGTPRRYQALTEEKKQRESTKELEAKKTEQDQLLATYEQYSDEDLEKRSQELAGNNWAMDPDSEAHTKELNEIQKVQEYRERTKQAEEEENAKEKYQTKREEVLSEAYAKGENVEALLNEFVDIERELKASAYKIPEAVSATEKAFESKDRLKEIGDELRRLGVDNVDVLRQYIGEKKDEEETEEKMAKIRSDIMEAKGIAPAAGYSAMDVLSELVAGPLAAAESVKRKFYADPEAPVNTSSELYLLKNMQNTTEQAANERIAKDASTAWGAKFGQMAYGVGMSTAKSMEMAALGSAVVGAAGLTGTAARVTSSLVTLPAFGTNAYATTLKEQQDRGVPTERAQQYALTSGLNEMLFEVLSMDKIYGTLHRSGKTAAKAVVLDLLANAGIEGSEEGMTDVANMIADNLINKGDSDYNRLVKDLMDQGYSMDDAKREADRQTIAKVGEDVFAGMLSGGLAGGTGNVYSAARNNHIAEVVSRKNPEVFEQLREAAKKSSPDSVAYEIANSEKATEELTREEKGSILASLSEQKEGDIQAVIEDRLVELGESKEQAKEDAEEILTAATTDPEAVSEEESDARAERFTENENLSTVYGELERGKVAPVQQAVAAVEHAYDTRKNTLDNVKSVQKDSGGNFVLKMKNGNTVRPQEMNIAEQDYDTRMVLGWAMEAGTPQEATQILENRPSNVPYQQYRTAFEGIKHAAMTEVPLEQLDKSFNEYTRMLAPEQVKSIYYLGENIARVRSEKNLTKENLNAAEVIAKAAGIKVQVGGRNLAGSNGIYNPADNTIYVSDKTLNPAAVVAGHELVHSMKQNAKDLYQKLNDTLVDFWKETDPSTYQRIYENRERRYADQVKEWKAKEKTDAEIADLIDEEIVAHATEALFEKWGKLNEKEREDVASRMAERDRNLAQRILDFVRDLLEKFKKALQGYKATSLEARTLRENIELLENFEDVFMNVLQEYGARNEAAGKTGELVDARGQETTGQQSEDGETRHLIKELPENISSVIKNNKQEVMRMKAVCKVAPHTDKNKPKMEIKQEMLDLFDSIGNMVESPEIGDVALTKRGVNEDFGHGIGATKISTINAIPDVLKSGKLVAYEKNWKNRGYDTAVIVAPVTIDGNSDISGEYLMGVIVKRNPSDNLQRYYLHESETIKKDEPPFETGTPTKAGGLSVDGPSLREMLRSIISASDLNVARKSGKSNTNLPMHSKKELNEIDEVFEAEAKRLGEVGFMDMVKQIDLKEVDKYFKMSTARKVAKELIDEYSSSMKMNELSAMIQGTFAYWAKRGNKADLSDIVKSMVGIARPLMDQTKIMDTSTQRDYENMLATLKGRRIKLTSTQTEELRSAGLLGKFRGKLMSWGATLANDGVSLDSIWDELVWESTYFLDSEENEGNMPEALMDTIEALRPKMGLGAYKDSGMDENEMAVDIALDIYGRFMKAVAIDAENKKLQEKIQRITNNRIEYREDIKKEYQRRFEEMKRRDEAKLEREREVFEWELAKKEEQYKISRARHDEKEAEKHKKSIEYYKKKLEETRQNRDEKILELRARYRNNNVQRKINQEIQQKRASVIRAAKSIGTLLSTNTDKKHVPEVLKKPVYDFISGVQYFGTGHDGPETKAELEWADRLEKMRGILGDETKAGTNLFYTIMDHTDENGIPTSSLLGDMDRFLQSHGSEKMMEMGIDTLVELNDIMKGLKRAIDNMNQLYVNARTDSAEELTKETVREMMKKKNAKNKGFIGAALDELLNVSQLDPYSYFHRFGAAGESVYRGFRKGLNDRINMINEAQEYFSKLTEGVDISKWEDERHTFNIGDREITLTTTQIMSLYELMKRKQAEEHIIFGGIRPDDIVIKGKTVVQRGIRLTLTEAAKITDKLTEDQKRIADGIQRFMNVNVANWGNRTTMLLYGYRRFLAKDYFPIRVDKNTVDTKDTSDFYGAHKPGAAHETIEHAKNTLVLQDIFTVLTNHVVEMATYSAYSAPIMDAMKWFNGRLAPDSDIVDINTEKDGSTKGQIERVYGKKMVKYFENLVKDINNERMGDNSGTMLYNKFVGNARAAAIMFNPRVIIQQPTAFFRANAIIDPKYLAKGFFTKKEGSKSAYEHAAIAKLKNWGYYETGIGNSIRSTITGHTTTREKIVDIGMWGAGKADDFTWGKIWNAVCWETKEKHPELREGTKKFYKAVEERYDDIIDQTQVIDSVLHRSQLMRSTNWAVKNATAFMSEPTKSYNILMNRARDWYEAKQMKDKAAMKIAGKAVIRASAAFVITGIINAAAQSLIDAMRSVGDEPEELYLDEPGERWRAYWKRFAENLLANATDNINPIELMPFVKDYAPYIVKLGQVMMGMDIEKNYSNDMSSQGLEKTLNGAQKIRKYITDPEYRDKNNIIDTFKPMLQGVSYLTGIGFYNGMRDVVAFIETLTGKRVGGWFYTDKQNQLTLADAVLLGDKEMYSKVEERMKKAGKEQKDIVPAAASGLRQKYVNGEITEDQYLQALIDAGLDPEDAYFRVEEQKYKLENGKDASYGRYKELASPLMEGDIGTFESMKKEYLDAGMDPDKLKKETCNAITEAVKEDIKAGTLTSDRQAQYLDAYQRLGYDREDQLKKIKKWRSEKD